MTEQVILNKLSTIPNGASFNIDFLSDKSAKVASAFKGTTVAKFTSMTARKGIKYDNLSVVKEARANGTLPATNDGLNGRKWIAGYEKLLLESAKGNHLLRLYFSAIGKKVESYYLINGTTKMSKEELEKSGIMQPSFFKEYGNGIKACFEINIDGILKIGK